MHKEVSSNENEVILTKQQLKLIDTEVDRFINKVGPFTDNTLFEEGSTTATFLREECVVLVVGAGGLGCELLKNLALSGFRKLHVIDMDTIELSNLNRQFLFRNKDIGRSKAIVAAEFIQKRIPYVSVTPHFCRIQDKDESFYSQFNMIIMGLDSIAARRWLNAMIVQMYRKEDPSTLKPIIDGGTEGLKGQVRVILPRINACFECGLDMFPKTVTFPLCTIANTPRLPEHCIAWASVLEWSKTYPDKPINTDDQEHVQWIYETAELRAQHFGISGVTLALTQGVLKNIIPAIASTNAIIAGACTNEALKLATNVQPILKNYFMYTGDVEVYSHTFELEKRPDCPVCGTDTFNLCVSDSMTVAELIVELKARSDLQLISPSLRCSSTTIYMQAPPSLEEMTRPHLDLPLSNFVTSGQEIVVTDPSLPLSISIVLKFTENEKD
ncbi:hypothetical protein HMI54_001519 [Coelomomyces lativittatus]|nr:hypothetical protein HMI56_000074 [Coelomomyces lativittatus]KAJ1510507.1 hypothetical protein HMI54_001519 [Coelomomyces lativittatus]